MLVELVLDPPSARRMPGTVWSGLVGADTGRGRPVTSESTASRAQKRLEDRHNSIDSASPAPAFVGEMCIHGEGSKARPRDTDCDQNIYFCADDPAAGRAWLEALRAFGVDGSSRCDDPGFVDAESGDFRLKEEAAARAVGLQPLPLERMLTLT